ncbi:MAG: ABC transporter permease [Acidobacteriota bacterium]
MPDLTAVWLLYRREMRTALREKNIVVNSILIPIFLYPFMLWAVFTGVMFVQGQTEGMVARVAVAAVPDAHRDLRREMEKGEGIRLEPADAAVLERIRDGSLDALLEFLPAEGDAARLTDNFRARVSFDGSKERSRAARDRLEEALRRYREAWLEREAARLGIGAEAWQVFTVTPRNMASGKEMGRFILGLMLPLFFVIMVAVGCFYPAIDATAGERERSTWETLMTVAAPRWAIVVSKYLVVTTFGLLAGILNLTAMTVTMRPVLRPLLERSGESLEFAVPLAALPVLATGALLLAAFAAAGMMVFAVFARTFKEGQSMVTPFYMLLLVPVMFLQVPGLQFSLPLALIPVVNVTMMIREAISGTFRAPQIALTLVSSAALVAGALALATAILRHEDVVIGSYGGSFNRMVKERLLARRKGGA